MSRTDGRGPAPGAASGPAARELFARGPDGVAVALRDWGLGPGEDSGKPAILFLHGFAQSQACWRHQVRSPLRQSFRLVTYDNRGHGRSDKPLEAHYYREAKRWADELDTVIRSLALDRPLLVAWSYAGRIALDYLAVHGDAGIAGLVMLDATSSVAVEHRGPAAPLLADMGHEDPARAEAAMLAFLENCSASPLSPKDFHFLLEESRLTPREVRSALSGRDAQYDALLSGLRIPLLAVNGAEDRVTLPSMARHSARLAPRGEALIYPGIGHMPFWEAPEIFNRDLAAFARKCQAQR